jgi:hypothetical protein
MSNPRLPSRPVVDVKEILATAEERCEVRWRVGTERIDPPVKDWREVRDVDFDIDSTTGELVLSFTRKNAAMVRRSR